MMYGFDEAGRCKENGLRQIAGCLIVERAKRELGNRPAAIDRYRVREATYEDEFEVGGRERFDRERAVANSGVPPDCSL